jgi:biopolymer transport protein ExbB
MMETFLTPFHHLWFSLSHFMTQGGTVLWGLAVVVCLSWILVIERILYLFLSFPKQRQIWIQHWKARQDQASWYARSIREGWLGQAHNALFSNMNIIKVLVTICPMIGLLGTVTGMISVFDIMAGQGSSDPKLMASGISLATLPTMAGMVAALVGVFIYARLYKKCQLLEMKLEQSLRSQK